MINPDFYTVQHIELEVEKLDIDEDLKTILLTTLERYERQKFELKSANNIIKSLNSSITYYAEEAKYNSETMDFILDWIEDFKKNINYPSAPSLKDEIDQYNKNKLKRLGDIHIGGEILPEFICDKFCKG